MVTYRKAELATLLNTTREGLIRGLLAEYDTAWSWISTKVAELGTALREWRDTAESEVRENVVELAKVVNGLREKLTHDIKEFKSKDHQGDYNDIIYKLKNTFEGVIEEILTAMDGLIE